MQKFINKGFLKLILAVAFIIAGFFVDNSSLFTDNYEKETIQFQKVLNNKENKLNEILNNLISKTKKEGLNSIMLDDRHYSDLYELDGLSLFIFVNNELRFWSCNNVSINECGVKALSSNKIIKLKNGWYRIIKRDVDNYSFVGLLMLKNEYKYENQYLNSNFQKDFNIDKSVNIFNKKNDKYNIYSYKNEFLFSLSFKTLIISQKNKNQIVSVFYLISVIFLISFLLSICFKHFRTHKKQFIFIIFSIFLIVLRLISVNLAIPKVLYNLDTFSPKFYASTSYLFPSFGDLFLNIFLLFFIVVILYKNLNLEKLFSLNKEWQKKIFIILGYFILFILSDFSIDIFKGIIINSNISYNVNNVFELNLYSYVGFLIIGVLFLTLFLIIEKLIKLFVCLENKEKSQFKLLILSITLFSIYSFCFSEFSLLYILWSIVIIAFPLLFNLKTKNILSFYSVMSLLIIYSVFSMILLNKFNNSKEIEIRKTLALKLTYEQDPIAEYIFNGIVQEIKNDSILKSLVLKDTIRDDSINARIRKKYFNGYWEKYDIQITTCRPTERFIVMPSKVDRNCFNYFNERIKVIGKPTICPELYSLNKGNGRINYLAVLSIPDENKIINSTNFFIDLNSKFAPKGLGYPELLLDKKVSNFIDPTKYSYAIFNNGQLVYQYGKYLYRYSSEAYGKPDKEFSFINKDNYNHLFCKIDDNTSLIIGKINDSFLDIITPFSYLFAFFSIIVLVFLFFRKLPSITSISKGNFKLRIQITTILIVFASLVIIGVSSIYYILNLFENKNYENIKDKALSVSIEMEDRYYNSSEIVNDPNENISDLLMNFANFFFTDVNVYSTDGNMIASSCSKIFNEGLISEKINPIAFHELSINQKTLFVHEEKIGNMQYLSAYLPLRNNNNKLLAYINIPYFSKQNEIKKELSTFLVALINIYVLLFALAALVSLFISNYITLPLQIIKEKISKLKLGKTNEEIEWKSNDEIGSLINEYNRMIGELSKSAEMLAKSERESAWREMAKQVAHEIKNPLTPMKLSVQHLEKAWNEKAPNFEERLKRFTKTLIEQIETLSAISSEFSDFAKMPLTIKEKIELVEIIEGVVSLYKNVEKIELNFINKADNKCFIDGDKSQIQRVITNLITNAIQAIPDENKGLINVGITEKENTYLINVSDNGTGISTNQIEKIFSPNFTTKTKGMGLGLAIVKSIVENFNGKIWFETAENIGTSFYIEFPKFS